VAGLLADRLAGVEQRDLATGLVLDRPARGTGPLLRFLISQRVPKGVPGLADADVGVARASLPSSIFASEAPTATRIARSSVTYWRAWSGVRMSGRPTISTSGTPARLKSISE
jgi:hypothetical protein